MFESILVTNKDCGRWSDIVVVMLPGITSWEITMENVLSMSVLERLISLLVCKIYGINEFEAKESKKSLVGWLSLQFDKLKLKLTRKKLACFLRKVCREKG